MNYIGNIMGEDCYEMEINGQTIQASTNQLKEAFVNIKNYEKEPINNYIENCPSNYIYEDSGRYELLRTKIIDDGYKEVKWNDELSEILETTVECAMETAHNWYTRKYHIENKI